MANFNWTCPYCDHAVVITNQNYSESLHTLSFDNVDGPKGFVSFFLLCPNLDCNKCTIEVALFEAKRVEDRIEVSRDRLWGRRLSPERTVKQFPDYVPAQIRADFTEATQIAELSPKASATLARRCLQGIIRDYWKVKPGRLVDEIEAIQDKVDATTWDAIDAVRQIGNIGAHMEKDVDVIVEVEPDEANLLLQLIETVITEWYVARHDREKRMKALTAVAAEKKAKK